MEATKNRTEVTFRRDSSRVKFFKDQTADLRAANKMMQADFAGMGYDPNFDAGPGGFANYLHKFTNSTWSDFSEAQIDVIKEIFCL